MIARSTFTAIFLLAFSLAPVYGQGTATPGAGAAAQVQTYEILSIEVEGVSDEASREFVRNTSQLTVGQQVQVPGAEAFSQAIRRLYRAGAYSDVSIRVGGIEEGGVHLVIEVEQNRPVGDYRFTGVKDGQRDELRNRVPLVIGRNLRESDVERSVHVIRDYFEEEGFRRVSVEVEREITEDGRVNLTFQVDRGPKVEVGAIVVNDNEVFSDRKIARAMETKQNRWWRVWSGETFTEDTYQEDLQRVISAYNEEGYYDARILRDTVYFANGAYGQDEDELIVELTVHEGPRYYVRNISWEGNTVYSDQRLTQVLGIRRGDVFNRTKMEENLRMNRRGNDVSGLYMNQGYMLFSAQPTVVQAPGDSVDIVFDVREGEVYEFGSVNITGNTKTKDHVIRRELYTLPGQTFSRDAIQRSIRQLQQLGYFSQESLQSSPEISRNTEDQTVDLTYSLEETGSDQLELSGGWGGGAVGLLLQASVTFNNFSAGNLFDASAWRPIPAGDGQKLSLSVQMGGRTYQNYSLSFQEPWFRGRPNPVGLSVSHYRADYGRYQSYYSGIYGGGRRTQATGGSSTFSVTRASASYGRRLSWPDDYFQTNWELGYQFYNVGSGQSRYGLPAGTSQQLSLSQTFSRNSLDNPRFPTSGSDASLSIEVAPPFGERFIQYHKTELSTSWNTPLVGQLTFNVEGDWSYLGSLTGDRVEFQRFMIGGTPLEARGFTFGKDLVFMRGYPLQAISPRRDDQAVGGTILNKYTAELRVVGIQSPQLQLAPYLFFDAANTWNGMNTYNPAQLYRSVGIGAKIFLPILGMVEVNYGRNLDPFQARGTQGQKKWRFQFTLGQGF